MGNNSQLIRACRTRDDTMYAATARTIKVTGNTGHHADAKAHSSSASGSGMVNSCPTYPAGRDRRVLRAQRNRCVKFSASVELPIWCSMT